MTGSDEFRTGIIPFGESQYAEEPQVDEPEKKPPTVTVLPSGHVSAPGYAPETPPYRRSNAPNTPRPLTDTNSSATVPLESEPEPTDGATEVQRDDFEPARRLAAESFAHFVQHYRVVYEEIRPTNSVHEAILRELFNTDLSHLQTALGELGVDVPRFPPLESNDPSQPPSGLNL